VKAYTAGWRKKSPEEAGEWGREKRGEREKGRKTGKRVKDRTSGKIVTPGLRVAAVSGVPTIE